MNNRQKFGLAALALALVAVSCSSSEDSIVAKPGPAVQADINDKVIPLSRDHEGPAILIDRDDPNIVYLAEVEMYTGACRFYVSTNRGASWTPENAPVLEPYTRNCAMGIATSQNLRDELIQGPDGTIFWTFQANDPGRNGSRSVLLGRTKDGGRSWQTVAIDPGNKAPEPGVEMEVNFQGHIAIDPANAQHIVAMWRRSQNNKDRTPTKPTRPYMAVSNDGGATWTPPKLMFERNNGFDGPRPIIADGKLYAFYRESAPAAPAAGQPPLPEPPTTKLYVAISPDDGRTWTKEDNEIIRANDAGEPVPVYDREAKTFYVTWHDNRDNELDVYFSSSKDGITWAKPTLLNDDPRGTRIGQHYPQMTQAPNGRLDVAWYDWRDDPFPAPTVGTGQTLALFTNRGKVASVYTTSSDDGGKTWAKNVKVNDVPIDRTVGSWINNIDVLAPIALDSENEFKVVAWSDTRHGNAINQTQDIYTSTLTFGEDDEGFQVTGWWGGVVGVLLGAGLAMIVALLLVRRQDAATPRPATVTPPAKEPAAVTTAAAPAKEPSSTSETGTGDVTKSTPEST